VVSFKRGYQKLNTGVFEYAQRETRAMANPEHLQILKQGVEAVRCSQHLTASKHPIPQA
jgi:hypothetical protein